MIEKNYPCKSFLGFFLGHKIEPWYHEITHVLRVTERRLIGKCCPRCGLRINLYDQIIRTYGRSEEGEIYDKGAIK